MKTDICVDRSISAITHERKFDLSNRWMAIERMIIRVLERVHHWQMISRQRSELRGLSDAMLKDIGISRADAEGEAFRHFWDDKGIRR